MKNTYDTAKHAALTGTEDQASEPHEDKLLSRDALLSALADWRAAMQTFDLAEEPLAMELAAFRLQESSRRYGCLAAQYRR